MKFSLSPLPSAKRGRQGGGRQWTVGCGERQGSGTPLGPDAGIWGWRGGSTWGFADDIVEKGSKLLRESQAVRGTRQLPHNPRAASTLCFLSPPGGVAPGLPVCHFDSEASGIAHVVLRTPGEESPRKHR